MSPCARVNDNATTTRQAKGVVRKATTNNKTIKVENRIRERLDNRIGQEKDSDCTRERKREMERGREREKGKEEESRRGARNTTMVRDVAITSLGLAPGRWQSANKYV